MRDMIEDIKNLQADQAAAYARMMGYDMENLEEWAEEFNESYAGEFDSEHDFAENLVDELGMLQGVDDVVARYFDYAGFAGDLFRGDYFSVECPGYRGVWVFRNV